MRVLTIASDLSNPFMTERLVRSCANVGLQLDILKANAWQGFSTKWHLTLGYLQSLKDRELDELILFTDAYDALFIRGEAHIVDAHRRAGRPVVFSAETNCWPLGMVGAALYGPAAAEPARYLNSGGYMGKAGDLLALQQKYPQPPSDAFEVLRVLKTHGFDADQTFAFSDQYWWTLIHLLERDTIGLDRAGEIFDCPTRPFPLTSFTDIIAQVREFKTNGEQAVIYQEELARLTEYFGRPAPRAAHVHFAGPVTKAAAEALLVGAGRPGWLSRVLEPTSAVTHRVVEL